ncbi:MAG TPA: hypothetical protein VK674_04620 [Candidatus Limnocylindria bacterium]|nr:hypothetical protein [Candidatus Limnocylindria bacterium]
MKVLKYLFAAALIAGTVAVGVHAPRAEATATTCKIETVIPVTIQDHSKNFTYKTVNGKTTVTGQFKVTGDANCKKEAVLAVWKMSTATGIPLEEQELFDYDNNDRKTFGPGTHTLTADVPNCWYQVDMLEGWNPSGFNGTANYGNLMHPVDNIDPLDPGHRRNMLDTDKGGDKSCDEEPETPENPKTPETPKKPQVLGKGTDAPAALPATGPGAVVGTFAGVTASAGAAHAIVSKRKNRK